MSMLEEPGAEGVRGLYPFLYPGQADLDSVLAEARRSTEEKAAEIIRLRWQVAEVAGDELVECAEEMAIRFASPGNDLFFVFNQGWIEEQEQGRGGGTLRFRTADTKVSAKFQYSFRF